jgi:3-phytase
MCSIPHTRAMPYAFPFSGRALVVLFCLTCCKQIFAAKPTPLTAPTVVPEAYVSDGVDQDELDSLATWRHPDGREWLIATGKSSHRLVIFDAETGQRLRAFGEKGGAPGQFKRPNGIAVMRDRLFVVERDNRRVQVFSLPDFAPLGSFGEAQMRAPYGLWLHHLGGDADSYDIYVTDSFMDGPRYDIVPSLDQLDQRVRRYRLRFEGDARFFAESIAHFGDKREATALRMVESLAGDTERRTLLIADEFTDRAQRRESTLREYDFDERFTGRSTPRGSFEAEAEGVALWPCAKDHGYWIAVDQRADLTVFRLFDRKSLAASGSFTGRTVAATDGIALRLTPSVRFPAGVLFAVHRDKAVAAFDLRDIVRRLKLPTSCL